MEDRGPSAYLAELIGTFFLVLFICLILTVSAGLQTADFAVIGLLHAFVLMMIIATIGGASGAHVNPAVTLALLAVRKISPRDAGIYVVMQVVGGVLAAVVVKALLDDEGDAVSYGATFVSEPFLQGEAFPGFIAEIIGTFVLMWAIMGAAVNVRAPKDWAPLVIGATLGFGVMAIGPLTGAGFNPARSFGPALISGEFGGGGEFLLVYVAGPVLGALAAAAAYSTIVLGPQERLFGGRLVDTDVPPGRVAGQAEGLATPGERPIDKLD